MCLAAISFLCILIGGCSTVWCEKDDEERRNHPV
jgi:hypothetical protein